MKKKKLLAVILLIASFLLGGCQLQEKAQDYDGQSVWDVLGPPTKELNFYTSPEMYWFYATSVGNEFEGRYPGVELNIQLLTARDMFTRIETERTAGTGPDLIFLEQVNDISQYMREGVFTDLNPIMKWDSTFHIEDFYENVLEAGVLNGKRYFLPVAFTLPVLISTEDNLEAADFNVAASQDFNGFIKELDQYYSGAVSEKYPFINDFLSSGSVLQNMWSCSGISLYDPEQGKSLLNKSEIKNLIDSTKFLAGLELPQVSQLKVGELLNQDYLVFNSSYFSNVSMRFTSALDSKGDKPVLFCIPSINGTVKADITMAGGIREGSPNFVNAYRYLALMLSDTLQSSTEISFSSIPVRKESETIRLITNHYYSDVDQNDISKIELGLNEYDQKLLEYIDKIDSFNLVDSVIFQMESSFKPYIEGTQSFDECYDEFEKYLLNYFSQ